MDVEEKRNPTYIYTRCIIEPFSEENIVDLCKKYNLRYHIAEGILFVSTETGNWRILHTEERVVSVFHQNLRPQLNKRRKGRFEYGYHKQNINFTDLEDVLKYIRVHDNSARYSYEKRNLDNLFWQISTQSSCQGGSI